MTDTMGRREALKLAMLGAAAAKAGRAMPPAKTATPDFHGLQVGLTSYSTRKLTLEMTVEALRHLDIHYISLKDMHLPLSSTLEERHKAKQLCEKAGVAILGVGVIYLKDDEAEMRHAFEYARDIGAPVATISLLPSALPTLNRVIKDFDILAAIHNHGPGDKNFPSPLGVLDAVQSLDKKIGCCVDVGHTARLGLDPVEALRKCAPRLYGIHIKDLADTSVKARGVPVGTGVLDVVGMLKVLASQRFSQLVALEYETDADAPIPGIAESFGFQRGALAVI
ncbi:MAG TPA: TIM barrel protein [Bryobacterales bacterium]|nr:TIM barrel protein [Bryobacterales bacterium]